MGEIVPESLFEYRVQAQASRTVAADLVEMIEWVLGAAVAASAYAADRLVGP